MHVQPLKMREAIQRSRPQMSAQREQ